MGKYTENNIYIPDEGEIGWGKEVNSNLYELSNILTKLTEINSSLQHLGNSITDVDSKSESEDTKLQNNLTATAQQLQSKISDTNDKIDVVNTRIDNLNLDKTKYADRSGISAVAGKVEHSITINGTVYDGSESINITTYTDSDINDLIKSVNNNLNEVKKKVEDLESGDFKMEVVNELPNVGRMHTMYFVPKTIGETESNAYDEYIWTGEKYELLGDTEAKLQNVYLKNDADERFVNTLNAQTINGTKTFTQSINGNISTANKLANSILINNTAFDGSQSIITNLWGQTVNANLTDGVHYSSTPINGASDFTLQIPNELDITVNGDLHGNADTSTLATNSINNQNGYELADTLVKDISFDNGKIIISSINNKEKNINLSNVESALKSNNSDHALLADNAINDSEGNKIDETYLKLSGGTLSDSISFANGGILFGNNSFKNIVTETESNFVFDLSDLDDKQKNILFKYGSNNIVTISSDGTVTANKFVGAVASASETANKLTNVRTIILNGDVTGSFEFDGSKDAECDITCTNSKLSETAIKLQTPRTIDLVGDVQGSVNFDGSNNVTINTEIVNIPTISNVANAIHSEQTEKLATPRTITLNGDVTGSFEFDGSEDTQLETTLNVTSIENANHSNTSDNCILSESTVRLQTPRTITLSGDVTGSVEFDGSNDVECNTTVNINNVENANHANSADVATSAINSDNSSTSNKLKTKRTINLVGAVQGSVEFDGSDNVDLITTSNINNVTSSTYSETASKLANPVTVALEGDVSGSVEFDGSANTSITTTLNVDTIENSNHANQANELAKSVNIGLSGAVQGSARFNGANDITIKTTSDLESTIMNNMVGNAKEGQVLSTIFDTTKNQNVVASYPLIEFCKIANTADILNQLKLVPVGMSTIFSDWYRFSHWRSEQNLSGNTGHVMPNNTYSGVEHAAARNGWTYDKSTNMIKSNRNSPVYAGFINPLKLKQWYLKVQIYGGGDGDNDGILINVAFMKDSNGIEHTVDLVRARSGAGNGVYLDDKKGMEFYWSLVYDYRQDTQKELANNPNVYCAPTNIPEYGWGTNYACMSCQRNVTNIKCYTSDVVSTPITTVNENSLINYTLPSSKPSDWSDAMWSNMRTMLLNASQMGVGAHSQNGLFTILEQRYIFNDEKIYDMVNDIIWEYSEKTNNWNNVGKCSTSLREGQIYYNESTKQTFYYTNGNAYCIGNGN